MTQNSDSSGELRAAFTMRLLENAKRTVQPETGAVGVFMRVTLAIIFMYLTVISYMIFETIGLIFISILALVAYFVPHLYRALMNLLQNRQAQKSGHLVVQESTQEG